MKIFDAHPEIRIEKPRRLFMLLGLIATGLACAILAVLLVAANSGHATALNAVKVQQAELGRENARLKGELASAKIELKKQAAFASTCSSNLNDVTSKTTAFAKQAAACEVIRNSLPSKG
jgi:hypothetical protein